MIFGCSGQESVEDVVVSFSGVLSYHAVLQQRNQRDKIESSLTTLDS